MACWDLGLDANHGPVFWDVGRFSFLPSFIPQITMPQQIPWTEHTFFLMDPSSLRFAGFSCRNHPLLNFRYSESWMASISTINSYGNFCRWLVMFVKTRKFLASCLKLFLSFSQESIRKLYDLSLSPTLTERSPAASRSKWFLPRVTQKTYHLLKPSAGVPAKFILSSRLLLGHRNIVLLDLIILFGK